MDNACSGKQRCTFDVYELSERSDIAPCNRGLIMYLEASYQCIKGKDHHTIKFIILSVCAILCMVEIKEKDGWMDGWMNGVLGHFFELSRLNWAGDNLG